MLAKMVPDPSSLFSFLARLFLSFKPVPGLAGMREAIGVHFVNWTKLVELG